MSRNESGGRHFRPKSSHLLKKGGKRLDQVAVTIREAATIPFERIKGQ